MWVLFFFLVKVFLVEISLRGTPSISQAELFSFFLQLDKKYGF